jgi:hypothetical protein
MRSSAKTSFETRKVSLDERSVALLAWLQEQTEAASDSEVVRQAVLHYERLVEEVAQHCTVSIRDQNGNLSEIPIAGAAASGDCPQGASVKRNLLLPASAASRFDDLRWQTASRTDSEVIRDAIAVYANMVSQVVAGNEIAVTDAQGNQFIKTINVPRCNRPLPRVVGRIRRAFDSMYG